jgi:hypothetical protein
MSGVVIALFNMEIGSGKYLAGKEYDYLLDDKGYHVTGENNTKMPFRLSEFNTFFKIEKTF